MADGAKDLAGDVAEGAKGIAGTVTSAAADARDAVRERFDDDETAEASPNGGV